MKSRRELFCYFRCFRSLRAANRVGSDGKWPNCVASASSYGIDRSRRRPGAAPHEGTAEVLHGDKFDFHYEGESQTLRKNSLGKFVASINYASEIRGTTGCHTDDVTELIQSDRSRVSPCGNDDVLSSIRRLSGGRGRSRQ